MNIAAWASKDSEDINASNLLKTDKQDQPNTTVTETCVAAWEDTEKAKYLARLFTGPPWSPINAIDPVIYKFNFVVIPKMILNLCCTLFFVVMGALYLSKEKNKKQQFVDQC